MKKFSLLEEEVEPKYELKDSLRNDIYSIIENTILLKFSSDKSVDSDVDIHGKEELVEKIKTLIDNVRINERIFTLEYVKTNVHRNFDMNWLNEQIDNLKTTSGGNIDYSQIKPGHQAHMMYNGKNYQVKIDNTHDDQGHACEPGPNCMVSVSWTLDGVPRKDNFPIEQLQIIQ